MSATEHKSESLPQRLCSEIQLFDLCDRDSCASRSNRFCTNPDMLTSFEKIADVEQRLHVTEELVEDGDEDDFDVDDDELSMDDFDGEEDDGWED